MGNGRGRPRKNPQVVISAEDVEIGEVRMSGVKDLGNGYADAYPNVSVESDSLTRVVVLPISKINAHDGDRMWSIVEANKVVSHFVAQGYKLVQVLFLGEGKDPEVYILGWFLAKQ